MTVSMKLHFWQQKFHFTSQNKILPLLSPPLQPLKNVKTIPSSWAVQKQAEGQILPKGHTELVNQAISQHRSTKVFLFCFLLLQKLIPC